MDTMVMVGILLLCAGFVLIGVEIVIPGFGLPGISGIACLIGGTLMTAKTIEQGLTVTMLVIVFLAIMITVILLVLKWVRPPFVLKDELKAEGGYLNASDLEYLIGREGTAVTDLKPVGKCDIDGVEFDVRTEGRYVEKGAKVCISRIHENTIMIKEI